MNTNVRAHLTPVDFTF